MQKIRVGIIGGAGYTAGELIRVLLNHPLSEIVFVNSTSNTGKPISDIHTDLIGETDLVFNSAYPFDEVNVLFLCSGHGDSKIFIEANDIPEDVKIIDLSTDYREKGDHDFVYGLPELNKEQIKYAKHIANPGCFATAIQLALLPLAAQNLIFNDIHVNAITGSTGAGQKPSETTHFSWRNNNISIYKPFEHQHLSEIKQSLFQLQKSFSPDINFIPVRGNFSRGIYATSYTKCDSDLGQIKGIYKAFYCNDSFVTVVDKNPDLKQVVGTNKCLLYLEKHGENVLIISIIDNLLKGASGQAVQNMNIMFGLPETTGLKLKAIVF